MNLLLLAQVASTLIMVGVIWFVQIVHYPLFGRVGTENFPEYAQEHQRLTSYVVAPVMLIELVTSCWFLWHRPAAVSAGWCVAGALLLLTIWLSTAFLQVPQHATLSVGFQREAQRFLVLTNWYRTGAWTCRGVIVLGMVWQSLRT